MKRLLPLALLALACQPRYADIELTRVSGSDPRVTVADDEIVIPIGIAAVVNADLRSDTRVEYERGVDGLELRSDDETIVIAEPTEVAWQFVLIGVGVGETCVAALVEGHEEACLPVRVIAQE